MRFAVCGPFEVPRQSRHLVTRDPRQKREFWEEVESVEAGLPEACGCYVFSINQTPWYVGLAEKQAFRNECFAPQKITKYDVALSGRNGRPKLFLVAKYTPGDRWAKPGQNGHRDIRLLESLLIGMALRSNSELENIKGTRLLRDINVPGILNSKKGQARAHSVQKLRRVMDA